MGAVIGELLPLALGVAISPIPIIAVILMLFSPHPRATGLGFLLGWLVGIVAVTVVFVVVGRASGAGDRSTSTPSAALWLKLILGVLLLPRSGRAPHGAAAARRGRRGSRAGGGDRGAGGRPGRHNSAVTVVLLLVLGVVLVGKGLGGLF